MKYLLEGQESKRLQFRRLKESDFSTFINFYKNPLSTEFWWPNDNDPEASCRSAFDKTFSRYANDTGGLNVLIDKSSGNFIGLCGLLIQRVNGIEELEIGYSIMPEFWNKGFASEAAQKCRDYAFDNNFSESLISIIHEKNERSQKVALKNGMHLDKETIYQNNPVHIYRITKTEYRKVKG
jgi:[ribosomal protein S5]-alanine N-acetyltransferase